MLVENLMCTPGLGVLAAKKKLGKSYMMLQAAQNIAGGMPFLGLPTKQGHVCYMALEDGEARIKARLEQQHAISNLPITYIYEFPF